MQRAMHGPKAPAHSRSAPHALGVAGVDEGPLAHYLELQGAAGLWARDTLLHTAAMFLHGSVPEALRNPPSSQSSGVGMRGGLQQNSQEEEQELQQELHCSHLPVQSGVSPQQQQQAASRFGRRRSRHSSINTHPRVKPAPPWGGFGFKDPLALAVDGFVGPDWLYITPPGGKNAVLDVCCACFAHHALLTISGKTCDVQVSLHLLGKQHKRACLCAFGKLAG